MKVCMLGYTFYEHDNRVRRYAESLVKNGHDVDVVALRSPGEDSFSVLNNVNVYKIQKREINEKGKLSYLYRIIIFFLKSLFFISWKHIFSPYKVIHVHSVPDFEVFAAFIPKLFGAKIILDIHDIVPEFFLSKFGSKNHSFFYKALIFLEKLSCSFSDHVIISNHLWYEKIVQRSVPTEKCTVILNYPDTEIFSKNHTERMSANDITFIYPGTLNWHQGLDISIKAFSLINKKVPNAKFFIYGKGPATPLLTKLVNDLNLNDRIFFKDPVSLEAISLIMQSADIGIIPKRNEGFGGEAFSTKSLEFMVLGIPIIISKTLIDSYYFNNEVVTFFNPGDENDLSQKMLQLINDPSRRKLQTQKASEFVESYKWCHNEKLYFDLIYFLCK